MPDWADVKDLYEVDSGTESEYAQEPAPQLRDPRCIRVELPGLPRFMKLPGPLQRLSRKRWFGFEWSY